MKKRRKIKLLGDESEDFGILLYEFRLWGILWLHLSRRESTIKEFRNVIKGSKIVEIIIRVKTKS